MLLKNLISELNDRQKELKKDYLFKQSSLQSSNKIPSFEEIWNNIRRSDGYSSYAEAIQHIKKKYTDEEVEDIIKDEVTERYDDIIYEYQNLDGEYCWRVLTLPKQLDPRILSQLGIYWAIKKHAAEAHWGKFTSNYKTVTYEAIISQNIIDWPGTIFSRMDLDLGESEQEIRFFKNAKIFVNNVSYLGNTYEINDYRRT